MFFVGLAGSMIPYILLMGVMLVFTLGANTEVMKKLSSPKESAKTIQVETSTPDLVNQTISFHFSEHQFQDKSSQELPFEASPVDECTPPEKNEISNNKLFSPLHPHYNSIFCTRYFGLSPPCVA